MREKGLRPEEVVYIADEFCPRGQDVPLLELGIVCIAVDEDQARVDPRAIKGGVGPEATARWLEAIDEIVEEGAGSKSHPAGREEAVPFVGAPAGVYTLHDQEAGTRVVIDVAGGNTLKEMWVKIDGVLTNILHENGAPWLAPWANRLVMAPIADGGPDLARLWNNEPSLRELMTFDAETKMGVVTRHGIVRKVVWKVKASGKDKRGAYLSCVFESNNYPAIERYFGQFEITITYRLKGNRLAMEVNIQGNGKMSLAFHPWFAGQGKVMLPAAKR
ncbi:MAG: hypothetical protein NT033_04050, partial [Candidatus Omnitrophica bacterium]|nr:hypothetical protein [Candidatus Omnitrophota bacterium]